MTGKSSRKLPSVYCDATDRIFTSVIRALNEIGVQYMLTGSVASNFYGQPRLTHDVDLAVALTFGQIKVLASKYPAPQYYLSEDAAAEAVKTRAMFNLIHSETGLNADSGFMMKMMP